MIRTPFLLSLLLLIGCGEAERPRFVPATADPKSGSSSDRDQSAKASRELTMPPKNIATH